MAEAGAVRAVGPSAFPRRPALEVSDLRFAYGPRREVLRIADLRVDTGSSVLFFGRSGSGKTTLLGLLAGVLTASSGRLSVLGQDLTQMSVLEREYRANAAVVPERLYPGCCGPGDRHRHRSLGAAAGQRQIQWVSRHAGAARRRPGNTVEEDEDRR
jgi:energy-coupling factor transporter ATP-binding protein EcfA2